VANPRGIEVADAKPGLAVWYWPSLGGRPFAGLIDSNPWQLVHGTWVVHLCSMELAYGAETGRPSRTTVKAAALTHLEVRELQAPGAGVTDRG
jgi:hypothetical protein